MKGTTVAVYANDALLLSELLIILEEYFPLIDISLYSSEDFLPVISAETPGFDVKNITELLDEDIVIILGDPGTHADAIRKLEASVIDCTEIFSDYEDVYPVKEPIEYIIDCIKSDKSKISGSLLLPVALFGKNGIDDLINQTRNIFSFGKDKSKVFSERVAFNVIVGENHSENIMNGYKKRLEQVTGLKLNLRIIPVSTVFLADFFSDEKILFDKDDSLFYEYASSNLEEAMENNRIGILRQATENSISFTGDYIKVMTGQMVKYLKELTGE